MSFAYSPKITTDGLVFYVDAANPKSYVSGSTTWSDLSKNNNNGTLTNGPTFDSNNKGSILYDGSDDYVQVDGFELLDNVNEFSINMWVKYGGIPTTALSLLSKTKTGFATAFDLLYTNDTTSLIFRKNTSTSWSNSSVSLSTTQFTNICLVQNPNELTNLEKIKAYINGQLIANESAGGSIAIPATPGLPFFIGALKQGNDPVPRNEWSGNIANTSIYNRALSATEVLQNYNATKTRFGL